MKEYTFIVTSGITLHTTVKALSLEDAITKAKQRAVQSLCHQCAHGEADREWSTSGELDCDPGGADLSDFFVEDVRGRDASSEDENFERAEELWSAT